jgi:hypothetical protein
VLASTVAAAEGVASTAVEVSTVADIVMGMAAVATAGITAGITAGVTAVVTGTVASCVVEYMAMAGDMAIPVLQDTIILMAGVFRTN